MAVKRSSRRSSACSKVAMGCGRGGGVGKLLGSEASYSLSAPSAKCPTATCPAYTGALVFILVLYLFFVALNWAFKPVFMLKPGVPRADPNSVEVASGLLYALLWTGIVLVAVGLVVRCTRCVE